MYSMLRRHAISRVTAREMTTLGGSMVIAELFYKFHSFTLECLAFLATWVVLGFLASLLVPERAAIPATASARQSGS
jgi:hypothetical protein